MTSILQSMPPTVKSVASSPVTSSTLTSRGILSFRPKVIVRPAGITAGVLPVMTMSPVNSSARDASALLLMMKDVS